MNINKAYKNIRKERIQYQLLRAGLGYNLLRVFASYTKLLFRKLVRYSKLTACENVMWVSYWRPFFKWCFFDSSGRIDKQRTETLPRVHVQLVISGRLHYSTSHCLLHTPVAISAAGYISADARLSTALLVGSCHFYNNFLDASRLIAMPSTKKWGKSFVTI